MFRRLKINTQERAVSTDINRLQAFSARGINEILRYMPLVQTSEDDPSAFVETNTVTSPLTATVLRGMAVRPAIASLNVLVDAGVMLAINDSIVGADDSVMVPVETAGVTSPGALVMTGNASGQVRIDVIECRINPTPSLVTDSRDIFDPTSGLFVASVVTKEVEQQPEFRVRAGTPGSGFPGAASGWLPLAVAYVPNGTTTNDTIDFWDVRPMAEDLVGGLFNVTRATSELESFVGAHVNGGATDWELSGVVRGAYKGRRIGGTVRRGTPGADADFVNLFEAKNNPGSLVQPLTGTIYYVYLLLPFGLPRWARYTDAASTVRKPRNPKGIPIISDTPPNKDGTPSVAISLAGTFAGATCSDGLAVAVLGSGYGQNMRDATFAGKSVHWVADLASLITTSSTTGTTTLTFSLDGTLVPRNAKYIYAILSYRISVAANSVVANAVSLKSGGSGGVEVDLGTTNVANSTGGTLSFDVGTAVFKLPIPQKWPANLSLPLSVIATGSVNMTLGLVRIWGYEL